MKGLFDVFFSRKGEEDPKLATEQELLLVNGRGKNTWWLKFQGETEECVPIAFFYRLNITSIPMGLKAMRLYDSLLTITYNEKVFGCERDYALIKNKQHVPSDFLSFEANLSRLEGNFHRLDLYAVVTNGEVNVVMTNPNETVKKGFLEADGFAASGEEIVSDMVAIDMDCQGQIRIEGVDRNVKGVAWIEKRYVEVAKHAAQDTGRHTLGYCLFPKKPCDERIFVYDVFDERSEKEKAQALVFYSDGTCKNYPAEGIFVNSPQRQKSSRSGKQYPFPAVIRIPKLELEVQVEPANCEQEMIAEDGIYSEYAGSGKYHGYRKDEPISGRCCIEMIGNFDKL